MKNLKKKKEKLFKKRNNKRVTNSFFFFKIGNSGFFFKNNINFEYVYLTFFKKKLKRVKILKFKFWIFLNKNYPLSSKTKNSRMGKGKGDFLRWTYKIFSNFLFFEFFNIHIRVLFFLKNFINIKLPRNIFIFFDFFNFFYDKKLFSNYSYFFRKKYLL